MMSQSLKMLQSMQNKNDEHKLSEAQMKQLEEISNQAMQGVRTMSFVMGVGPAGSGMYSNTVVVMQVDNAKAYLDGYEKAMMKMSELMQHIELPFTGPYQVEQVHVNNVPALRITMEVPKQATVPGVPDLDKLYEMMFGPGGKISIYLASADEQTVVMGYVSPENLQRAIEAARSTKPRLAADPLVSKTSALLSPAAQWVGYLSPGGAIQFASQVVAASGQEGIKLPEFPPSPPLGMSLELTAKRLDGQFVIPVEAIDAIVKIIPQPEPPGEAAKDLE
jgi:hypothetical protein